MIEQINAQIKTGSNLSKEEMQIAMQEILSGRAKTPEIAEFLEALTQKGETLEEITAAVEVMRQHAVSIRVAEKIVLDTCGTGGDKKGTFNISTASAFVASACGICVAKHGNRSVSSSCGSADILEALGVNINLEKEKIEKCLEEIGIAFLFAPNLHPAMKYAMPARKQLSKRTIFNILGPLSNPARAKHQLVGVYDKCWTAVLAQVLADLGTVHALVVHGEDGLDEITTVGKTFISEAQEGKVTSYSISPENFALKKADLADLKGGSILENAKILLDILRGEPGPKQDIVVLNAAAAIYAADKTGSIASGITLAQEAINSGKALEKLELLKKYSA